jgi:RNA polymerase sigma-70 factor, ECF subfamily
LPSSPTDSREDIRLLAAVADGDRGALRELYARYRAPLFSLALEFTSDAGAAEEALQDTFVKIWRHAPSYDVRKSRPFTWAVTILRRTCIDQRRRTAASPAQVPVPDDDAVRPEFASEETVRHTAEIHEATDRVRAALATVAVPQRDALELALFSTLTHPEIACRLGQPLGTIKSWIRRGLLDLRTSLHVP